MAELDFAPGELTEDQYEVHVLVEPEEGFLGVGGVDAEVEVELTDAGMARLPEPEPQPEPEAAADGERSTADTEPGGRADFEDQGDFEQEGSEAAEDEWQPQAGSRKLREFLELVLREMSVEASLSIEETADTLRANVSGDDLGLFIGKRGQTLDAIEYLAGVMLYPNPDARKTVEIDASGYKERRRIGIERIALSKAQEAVRRHRAVELEAMTSAERKIVHVALRDRRDVTTESTGDEPERRVVIKPAR